MKTIVLDPGHGGYDSGAVNGNRYEKNDNLRMGLAVRDRLMRLGQQRVIMTRSTDTYVDLLERSRIANNANADIFVSLHRNSFTNPASHGWENFVQIGSPARSWQYAQNVLNECVSVGVQSNRGVKQENYSVLRFTAAPAQLLEMGFITNTIDNIMFDENFNGYADAIARGILISLGEPTGPPTTVPPSQGDPAVRAIQQTLNERYGTRLTVDGVAGPLTRTAMVIGLQTELNRQFNSGLVVDGIFGNRTRAAVPNLRVGARGNVVWLMQAALYLCGYNIGVDGVFGPNTDLAVRRFQLDNGLIADGIAGPITFERLFR